MVATGLREARVLQTLEGTWEVAGCEAAAATPPLSDPTGKPAGPGEERTGPWLRAALAAGVTRRSVLRAAGTGAALKSEDARGGSPALSNPLVS